ncbi:rab11 family-interacting protein 2 [Nasonia vitripennis]|uniref:Rab11 family-interacting protein 1 n=1 Tax=Nasonia vitripennis TaxID=7425 RepID=A0A7M7GCH2_NASVI|nr:rab11 family-interacting protein 2 [Nasonia vitripennis]
MWSPTHVQVIVQRAKGLITKGKNKTNDCFVTIALGKEKYQTSVKEKAAENVEWHEECELQIPQQGNTAEIVLTALHRNFIGVDEFLGTVRIPLSSFDIYEMPKNRWYELTGKPGKENTKERGKLEVRIGFIVRAGSLTDLTKKERHKSSLGQLSSAAQSFGGSLLSIGSLEKRKGLKKLAKSIGNKVKGKSRSKSKLDDICDEEEFRVGERPRTAGQEHGDADPGVVSDEDDEFTFDDLSHKSSTSSLNSSQAANQAWKNSENLSRDNRNNSPLPLSDSSSVNLSNQDNKQATSNSSANTPPSKPPRFALNTSNSNLSSSKTEKPVPAARENLPPQPNVAEDEWGQKLYGLQTANALKRWDNKRNSPKIIVDEPRDSPIAEDRSNSPITRLRAEVAQQQQTRKEEEKQRKEQKKQEKKDKKEKNHQKSSSERIIIGGEETNTTHSTTTQQTRLPREIIEQFDGKSREDLIELVMKLQLDVADKKKRLHDMEDYIDALLLRVIECSPRLLQNPYQPARRLSSPGNQ